MQNRDHVCDACGGAGLVSVGPFGTCEVCLGRGRISDQMPTRDAIADAATLRTVVEGHDYYPRNAAEMLEAIAAVAHPKPWHSDSYPWHEDDVRALTCSAARIAFSAVPGLRGQ